MTIVVEDGTGSNSAANSYADVTDLRSYAALRGITTLPAADGDCEPLLIKAMDYIEAQGYRFKGVKTAEKSNTSTFVYGYGGFFYESTVDAQAQSADQPLQWPRSGVWVDNRLIPDNEIPREIIYAQFALAIEAITQDLQPNRMPTDSGPVVEKQVGSLKLAYSNPGRFLRAIPAFAKADALLTPFYQYGGMSIVAGRQ